jgi:hypothetical protein
MNKIENNRFVKEFLSKNKNCKKCGSYTTNRIYLKTPHDYKTAILLCNYCVKHKNYSIIEIER